MRVVILLGINCAFYPSDTVSITYKHIHFDAPIPYHDFRRAKTRRKRMAALWPETVAAIRDYTDHHRPQSECGNVLLTRQKIPHTGRGGSVCLANTFNELVEKVGHRPRGVSLGSLRHTYGTVMDLVSDTPMVDLTMGHVAGSVRGQSSKSLQRRIYSQFNLNELKRLKAVADVVHDWLYDGKFSDTAVDGGNP
jgi:integrase